MIGVNIAVFFCHKQRRNGGGYIFCPGCSTERALQVIDIEVDFFLSISLYHSSLLYLLLSDKPSNRQPHNSSRALNIFVVIMNNINLIVVLV